MFYIFLERFLQFLKGQKELEEVFIKNLFDIKLSIGKCLLTISWSELGIKSADTIRVVRPSVTLFPPPLKIFLGRTPPLKDQKEGWRAEADFFPSPPSFSGPDLFFQFSPHGRLCHCRGTTAWERVWCHDNFVAEVIAIGITFLPA